MDKKEKEKEGGKVEVMERKKNKIPQQPQT